MENKEKKLIGFYDLNVPMRIAIIAAYVVGGIYALAFLVGFILGLIY
jgi:hypothetical protein